MAFSPDSTKLAVAQSDNIVFVYKLGAKWGEKKSICNKYPQTSSVTTLCWPLSHTNELFFGCADGKVRIGDLRKNKSSVIYGTEDYVVSLCCNPKGTALLGGHLDGTIYMFSVSSTGSVTKVRSACVPRQCCVFIDAYFVFLLFCGRVDSPSIRAFLIALAGAKPSWLQEMITRSSSMTQRAMFCNGLNMGTMTKKKNALVLNSAPADKVW